MTLSQQILGRSIDWELASVTSSEAVTPIGDAPWEEGKGPSGAGEATWLQVSWNSHGTSPLSFWDCQWKEHMSLGCGHLPVGEVCCVAVCHLITTAAWAFPTVFPRPQHSRVFICGCTCFLIIFLFVRSPRGNLYASFNGYLCEKHKLAMIVAKDKTSVSFSRLKGHYLSKNGLISI